MTLARRGSSFEDYLERYVEWPEDNVLWSPESYDEAVMWLDLRGGDYLVTPYWDDAMLVAVGLRGRSAGAVAPTPSEPDVRAALLRAVRALVQKL